MSLPPRFWDKVQKTESCWLWTAACSGEGYGAFHYEGKVHLAHRLAYIDAKGPIPESLECDHLCRVRRCCKPDHLEAVTRRENIYRSPITNASKIQCIRDHNEWRLMDNGHRRCKACHREESRRRALNV